jgi:D-glycero-D-manno-heptose 1,7-bisphosphate phosphatase
MPPDQRPAAFIDRDGVINEDRHHVHRIEDFVVIQGVVEGLRQLQDHGYALVVVTNQAGIAKGLYSQDDYDRLSGHMIELMARHGVRIDGVYHCPHHPEGSVPALTTSCDCRKPAPGMMNRAARELGLDLEGSAMIGDKLSDVMAGRAAGVGLNVLVESGHALPNRTESSADYRCADLRAAAEWICANGARS